MKNYSPEQLRTISVIGHGSVGKTSLCDSLTFTAGTTDRLGSVDAGTSFFDFSDESIEKKHSLSTSFGICEWKNHKINIIDTPGLADFYGEAIGGIAVSDGSILIIEGVSGVEVGSLKTWNLAKKAEIPVMLWVNRIDRDNVDFLRILDDVKSTLNKHIIPAVFPMGTGPQFKGLINVISGKAVDSEGKDIPIPDDFKNTFDEYRRILIESAAESDEELMESFFENETLTDEELKRGVKKAVHAKDLFLLFCGLSIPPVGQKYLLDAMVDFFPSPLCKKPVKAILNKEEIDIAPDVSGAFVARVFKLAIDKHVGETAYARVLRGSAEGSMDIINSSKKNTERLGNYYFISGSSRTDADKLVTGDIVAIAKLKNTGTSDTLTAKAEQVILPPINFPEPVYRASITAKTRGDEDKMGVGLSRLTSMDPTFIVRNESEINQTTVSGMGEQHLSVMLKRLQEMTNVEAELSKPGIAYHETITKTASGAYKHKKQSGGRGQYGHVLMRLEPLGRGEGYIFESKVVGGNVPTKYIPAVEKGVLEAMINGPISGSKVVDVKAVVYDGSSHSVDSSDMAFKIAGRQCYRQVMMEAGPILLEPVMSLEITVPDEFMGDVMGDINTRRGKILGMESEGNFQILKALIPQAELYQYTSTLRSLTQARGSFSQTFSHYNQVPRDVQDKIAAESAGQEEQ